MRSASITITGVGRSKVSVSVPVAVTEVAAKNDRSSSGISSSAAFSSPSSWARRLLGDRVQRKASARARARVQRSSRSVAPEARKRNVAPEARKRNVFMLMVALSSWGRSPAR